MSEDQDKFIKQIKQQLDQESKALDAETLSRLRQARARALSESDNRKSRQWSVLGGGAVAFASVSVLAIAVWLSVPTNTLQNPPALAEAQITAFDDLELLAATEELEFYEDMEFYYWLEIQNAQS